MKIETEENDEDALKHKNIQIVCKNSDVETEFKCFKCGSFVSVGSPAYRKAKKKICGKCFFKKKKISNVVVSMETAQRAAEEISRRRNVSAS